MFYLRIVVAVVVMVVWATVVLGSFIEGRNAPPELSAIMLAVVSYLLGGNVKDVVRKRRRQLGEFISGAGENGA